MSVARIHQENIHWAENAPDLGGEALSATSLNGDMSRTLRNGHDFLSHLGGIKNPAGSAALGVTSCLGLVTGVIAIQEGAKEFESAEKIGDVYKQAQAGIKCARGGVQITAGAVYVPARTLAIVGSATVSQGISEVSKVLGKVGSSLVGAAYLLTGISGILNLIHLFSEPKLDEKKCALAVASVLFSFLGVAAAILMVALTGGVGLIAIAVLEIVAGVGCTLLDGYQFIQAIQAGKVGKYDELWLLFTTALCVAAVGIAIAFSGGVLPLVVACVLGSLWLVVNLAAFCEIHRARAALDKKGSMVQS